MNAKLVIEALLFVAGKPLSYKKCGSILSISANDVKKIIKELQTEYYDAKRGMAIITTEMECQMTTAPDVADVVQEFFSAEQETKLTPPSLEALTVIAYRGPMTKQELEYIRGVNCSLILRNLLIRGFIDERVDEKIGLSVYSVTLDFLSYMGVADVSALPRYEELSHHPDLEDFLAQQGDM
ncbi:MAG: SMC-Scp complex subunit ScpB [Candidatus Jacksonbacteria bacterium RIFCSPLOWO2_02_FULL_43_9]|nr:MAG: Segregation and condensation protein B [Parcubacteria group bacterium GW2011_GWA2_43_13]OGY69991.1 MAG: SMC-Scp complex subunit ScpB [Candidatus Jacksonbacteria bacterium RIFCSPHIGHO2_02_FULL_43_10]OGY71068.1 MAG: SMC-Scp complex subunit ScpB [Candidatus Jacksonbacteria bacterium RIFCSPLOWO2_01_FULL_44_13]OGY73855.1 MAG: SMC-Scp complex subunit ScpB [Candidatus Jacksonbacteria bacterium RIFCSPLOWO2_02_FULL_43_9]HAZ16785.1 SMC-Scp complex subunit ScpB [Candidatus Jacksonbacteria bacteriu